MKKNIKNNGLYKLIFTGCFSLLFGNNAFSQCSETLDQSQTVAGAATYGADQWQSFIPGITGYLTKVELKTNGFSSGAQPYTFAIHSGQGTGGPVLYSGSGSFNTPFSQYFPLAIPVGSAPFLTAGLQYTVRIQISGAYSQLSSNNANIYPNGIYFSDVYGTQSNWDLVFNTYITPNLSPVVTLTGTTDVTCNGGNDGTATIVVTSGSPGFTYAWAPGGQTVQNPNNLMAGTYIVTVTDANGCTGSASAVINQPPAITITPTITHETCDGVNDGAVTLSATGGVPPFQFQVDGSGFIAASTFSSLPDGNHTYDVQDANGCMANGNFVVNQGEVVTANFSFNNGCQNTPTINFTDLSSASSSTISGWNWTFSGASPSSATIQNVSNVEFFTAGLNNVSLSVVSGNGCVASVNLSVTIFPAPFVDAGVDASVCVGTSFTQAATVSGGTAPYSIAWNPGGNFSDPTIEDAVVTTAIISAPGTFSHIINAVDVNGCADSDTMIFTVNPNPTVNAGNDFTICQGDTAFLSGSGSGSSFNWSAASGFNSTLQNDFDFPTGNTDYVLTTTNSFGCSAFDSVLVTVNPPPIATISGGGTFCEGDPNASITITSSGFSGGGDWSIDIFQNSNLIVSPVPSGPSYILSGLSMLADAGTYTGIIHDLVSGCSAPVSGSVSITINPEPVMTLGNVIDACETTLAFDLNSVLAPSPSGGTWSGTGVSGTSFNPGSVTVGTYDVIYTMSGGCDDTIQVVVNASPTVTMTGVTNAYCQNDPVIIPNISPAGGLFAYDNSIYDDTFPNGILPDTIVGSHTLGYQYTDTNGCTTGVIPIAFTVYAMPLDPVPTSVTSQTICPGNGVTFTASNPNTIGGTSLAWYSDPGLTSQVATGPTFNTPVLFNSTTYYLVIQNAGCKTNPINMDVVVITTPVSAGPDIFVCPGTPAQLNVNSAPGTYLWSPGINLNDSTVQNPLASPNVNTTYSVTVTIGTCVVTDYITVFIDGSNPDCGIEPSYNAFSPDGDGTNETWILDAAYVHPDNTVTIFNRWGDKLLVFEDYDNTNVVWDGTYNGQMLPSGTYFYLIEYHDIRLQVSGWVQLTR